MDRKIVTVALLTVTTCAALSGFYYDNGVDQTVVHKQLSKREKREMQSEILHLLGLQHRPHPSFGISDHRKIQEAEKVMSNSAPRFLIDVYQSLTEEDSGDLKLKPDLIEKEFNVSDKDVNSMDEADVIMSFINRGQHLHGIRHHHGDGRFWFDLSEVPNLTTVIAAELRLFINQSIVREEKETFQLELNSKFDDEFEEAFTDEPNEELLEEFTLTLYEIGTGDSLSYVDRVEVDSHQEGWVAFNVTLVLSNWLNKPEENFGLQLVCRHASTGRQISAREVGMVGSHGNQKLQPFMVAFFRSQSRPTSSAAAASVATDAGHSGLPTESEDEEDEEDIPRSIGRFRRQANNNRKRSKEPEDSGPWNPYADFNAHYARRSCQKKNLYVSFRDLGWQDWIIAPDGYAAFYCNGECSFPLNAHMNASNHAIVQTLVHLMNPYRVPKPCCAPIKLSSISVLYFDDNSNVILKKYRNMVVKSCGCH